MSFIDLDENVATAPTYLVTTDANQKAQQTATYNVTGAVTITPGQISGDMTTGLQALLDQYAGKHIKLSGEFAGIGRIYARTNTILELTATCTISPRALTSAEQTQENQDVTNAGDDYRWGIIYLESGARLRGEGKINGLRAVRPYAHGVVILNTTARCKVAGVEITNCGGDGVIFVNAFKIHVERCDIYNLTGRGIHGVIAKKARINNNEIDGVLHGIQWWGDETNGYCEAWSITGNIVSNCTSQTVNGVSVPGGGGIWGKLGKRITVTGNTIDKMDDVGADFEKCYDCTATGNTISDCKNAAMSVFYASERITFANNTVTQGTGMGKGFKAYGTGLSKDITIRGGSITTTDSGADGVYTDAGVCESLTVDGVTIVCNGGAKPVVPVDCHRTTIVNCPKLQTTGALGIDILGGSYGRISGNTLIYSGTDSANARGIRTYWRSANYPGQYNHVFKNTLIGFGAGIYDDNNGNAASYNVFEHNITPSVTVNIGANWTGRRRFNRTDTGVICDGSTTNSFSDSMAPKTGGRVFWDGNTYDTTVETIVGITGNSGVVYAPILTLPATSGGTYDQAIFSLSLGGWGGSTKKVYTVMVGQRDGLSISYTCQGQLSSLGQFVAYQAADGSTILYALVNAFAEVGIRYLKLNQSTGVTALNWSTATPAGTLVYDSANNAPTVETNSGGLKENGRTVASYRYSGSTTFSSGSIAAGGQTSTTVTVAGAALGNFVIASCSLDLKLCQLTAYVSAANTVTIVIRNGTAAAQTIGSATYNVRIFS